MRAALWPMSAIALWIEVVAWVRCAIKMQSQAALCCRDSAPDAPLTETGRQVCLMAIP